MCKTCNSLLTLRLNVKGFFFWGGGLQTIRFSLSDVNTNIKATYDFVKVTLARHTHIFKHSNVHNNAKVSKISILNKC